MLALLLPVALLPAATVLCVGDSLTAGQGVAEEQAWPAELQRALAGDAEPALRAWRVVNAGISGDTTAGGRRRLPALLKRRPELVVLALGANDGLRLVPVAEVRANLDAMLTAIREAGARPLLAGMQLPPNYGEEYRGQFAAVFPALAEKQRCALVPFLLAGVAAKPELNQGDGIHPNADGHRVVAATVLTLLRPLLLEAQR